MVRRFVGECCRRGGSWAVCVFWCAGGTDIVTPAYFLQDLEKFTTHRTEAVAAGAGGGALGTTDIDLDI